ncbi:MAG: response regulator transcription factor [Bacteroidales bacterium]|nr:response regulator transcription factor [Bacteroidales bacterium]
MSKKVLVIVPSIIAARGLESIFSDLGEFQVAGILRDLSQSSLTRLRSIDADAIILDPSVLDYESRHKARARVSEYSDASVIAFQSGLCDEESLKQFDEIIGLYDDPTTVIRKVREAISAENDSPKTEGEELSAREKEILVSVAKGMLNKEIADQYNISIYTVITHRKNITRKTGIKTVAGLTVYALLNNLIDVNSFE